MKETLIEENTVGKFTPSLQIEELEERIAPIWWNPNDFIFIYYGIQ